MKKISSAINFFCLLTLTVAVSAATAQQQQQQQQQQAKPQALGKDVPSCTGLLKINGAISPGTVEYVERSFAEAQKLGCVSNLILIDAGGVKVQNLQSTRLIVEKILASPVPILCLVSPFDDHAPAGDRSQGGAENILKACHFSGETSEMDVNRFLEKAQGKSVTMSDSSKREVAVGALTLLERDWPTAFLEFATEPEIAYLIFMASLAFLFFEITHPGVIAPGVVGVLGLILSLISFHKLNIYWGALGFIGIGMAMLVLEAFVPSFGALGIGGIVALAFGSFLLFDTKLIGVGIPLHTLIIVPVLLGAVLFGLVYISLKTLRLGKSRTETAILGKMAVVSSLETPSKRRGMVSVNGEFWRFTSEKDVDIGDQVEIQAQDGLIVKVQATKI